MAKYDHKNINLDCDHLLRKVTEHGDYPTAEDHDTTRDMRRREDWKGKMGLITEELSLLTTTINSNNIPHKTKAQNFVDQCLRTRGCTTRELPYYRGPPPARQRHYYRDVLH